MGYSSSQPEPFAGFTGHRLQISSKPLRTVSASDFQINSKLRAILARHWIDSQQLRFGSFRGTVRFSGKLAYLGARDEIGAGGSKVEILERAAKALQGVRRVYFDLENWHRTPTGAWECKDQASEQAIVSDEETRDARDVANEKGVSEATGRE